MFQRKNEDAISKTHFPDNTHAAKSKLINIIPATERHNITMLDTQQAFAATTILSYNRTTEQNEAIKSQTRIELEQNSQTFYRQQRQIHRLMDLKYKS